MAVRFTPGAVLQVPLSGGRAGFAVMLAAFPYVAFYADDSELADGGVPSVPPMFVVAVARRAYSGGGWGAVLYRLGEQDLPSIPLFFRQNVTRAADCEIVDAFGGERKAAPAECVGLESDAVWEADHIESRIEDYYAGRPNAYLEAMRLKV